MMEKLFFCVRPKDSIVCGCVGQPTRSIPIQTSLTYKGVIRKVFLDGLMSACSVLAAQEESGLTRMQMWVPECGRYQWPALLPPDKFITCLRYLSAPSSTHPLLFFRVQIFHQYGSNLWHGRMLGTSLMNNNTELNNVCLDLVYVRSIISMSEEKGLKQIMCIALPHPCSSNWRRRL